MISGAGYNDYANYYLSQFSQTQGTNRTQGTSDNAITIEGTRQRGESDAQNDDLTLSEDGLKMADMMGATTQRPDGPPSGGSGGPPPGGGPRGAGGPEGNSFAQELEEEEESFYEELMAKLEEAGIDTEQEIELGYDEEGNIVVTSDIDAEDKALIESILAEDEELAQSYANLTEMRNMATEMEAMSPQGPPPEMQGMQNGSQTAWMAGGQIANASNIASMYASQSTMSSNSIILQATQAAT